MDIRQKNMWITIAVILALVALSLFVTSAKASGDTYNTYNTYNETNEAFSYSSGLSDNDIVDIVSGSIAAGSHHLSPLTTRWQISFTGATTTSDFDEETNFSFAIGKRFGKDHWMPNALWHASFSPDIQGNDYVAVGATVPLGE